MHLLLLSSPMFLLLYVFRSHMLFLLGFQSFVMFHLILHSPLLPFRRMRAKSLLIIIMIHHFLHWHDPPLEYGSSHIKNPTLLIRMVLTTSRPSRSFNKRLSLMFSVLSLKPKVRQMSKRIKGNKTYHKLLAHYFLLILINNLGLYVLGSLYEACFYNPFFFLCL